MKINKVKPEIKDPEKLRKKAEGLIKNFKVELRTGELRGKVLAMIPIFKSLRDLGKSLIPGQYKASARDRILQLFSKLPENRDPRR